MEQLMLARQRLAKGDLAGAEALCGDLSRAHPDRYEIPLLLGDIALKRNDLALAERYYRESLGFAERNPWAHVGLGGVFQRLGRLDEAAAAYSAALVQDANFWPHVCLGDILLQQGDAAGALNHYRAAHELNPAPLLPKLGLANASLQLGDLATARQFFTRVLEQDASQMQARLGLGKCALAESDWERAAATFRELLVQFPDDAALLALLDEAERRGQSAVTDPEALLADADRVFQEGDLDQAAALYERLLPLLPERAHPVCQLGNIALQAGQLEVARQYFEQGRARQPLYPWSHVGLGDCLARLDQWPEALAAYQEAAQLKPGNDYIRSLLEAASAQVKARSEDLGNLLLIADRAFGEKDFDVAAQAYQHIVARVPDQMHAHCRLGEISLLLENAEEALAHYQRAVAIDGNYVWAQYGLGQTHAFMQCWPEARDAFARAHAQRPDLSFIADQLARAEQEAHLAEVRQALKAGQLEQAEEMLAGIVLREPTNPLLAPQVQALLEARGIRPDFFMAHQVEIELHRLYLKGVAARLEQRGSR